VSAAFTLEGFDLDAFVASTLAEDLGPDGRDVTSEAVIPADAIFDGVMDSRDAVTLAGLPIAVAFFRTLDPDVEIELLHQDGDRVAAGTDIMRIRGKARALLTAERSALNTVQHLTGIATMTGHGRDLAGYTQDDPRSAPAREICHPHGRRDQSSHGPVGCGDDQG